MKGELLFENGDANGTLEDLLDREGRIERSLRHGFHETGLELAQIRDKRLYKVKRLQPVDGRYSHDTWEEYCDRRWGWKETRTRQLIEAAEAVSQLQKSHNCAGFLPSHESHVRELLKLEKPEERTVVWQSVIDRSEAITAKVVEEEVTKFINRREKNWYTVAEWEAMGDAEWEELLNVKSDLTFNKQDTTSIEWAQWSWNPVTGCKHDCPYCYARDIANRFYAQKFEPAIYPSRLWCPKNTKVPAESKNDVAFKNVFTCSMADLFGRWVPTQWIEHVMQEVSDNPQWNFLFLTKFPQRFAELGTLPKNAWMGTTVDCQDRVANAEKAFAKLGGGTKWLSCEPLLTPLKFKSLEMFDWVVIGGASASSQTPVWIPPFDWVVDLHNQARKADCAIYHKENCADGQRPTACDRLREFPWIKSESKVLPKSLTYLGMKS